MLTKTRRKTLKEEYRPKGVKGKKGWQQWKSTCKKAGMVIKGNWVVNKSDRIKAKEKETKRQCERESRDCRKRIIQLEREQRNAIGYQK